MRSPAATGTGVSSRLARTASALVAAVLTVLGASPGGGAAWAFDFPAVTVYEGDVLVDHGGEWLVWGDYTAEPPGWPLREPPLSVLPLSQVLPSEAVDGQHLVPLFPDPTGAYPFAGAWVSGTSSPFMGLARSTFEVVAAGRRRDFAGVQTALVYESGVGPTQGGVTGEYEPGLTNLYFTRDFEVADPSAFVSLQLELEFASGAIAYINGREVARHHVDPGYEPFGNWATPYWLADHVNQTMSRRWQQTFMGIDASILKPGRNTIAVAVHKRPTGGPRAFYFDLQLRGHERQGYIRSPYLQRATPTSMTVMWETNFDGYGYVEYGKVRDDLTRLATEPRIASAQQEVTLDPLEPGTRYYYRVHTVPLGDERLPTEPLVSPIYFFTTTDLPGEEFTFVAYGDNRSQVEVHQSVVRQMWDDAIASDARFVISTGDLVENGSPWEEWQDQFFKPALPLMSYIPYYTSLGNHEGNHESYYQNLSLPGNESWYSFVAGDAELFALNSGAAFDPSSPQYAWLVGALQASTSRWKIAFFHHPPYACTPSRKPGDLEVQQDLVPVFEQFGVQLVIMGHDHLYGRSREMNGVTYVITGGGGAPSYPAEPDEINPICLREYHYCMVEVSPDKLSLRAIALGGVEIDRFTLRN